MKKILVILLLIFNILSTSYCSAQGIIWAEDFTYADGTTTGANNNTANPAADWTSGGCGTCSGSTADWWEIRSGVMEARDVNGDFVFLQTESIDISTLSGVGFSVSVTEN